MVESYDNETYVAYLDISGFAYMMNDLDAARNALNKFYTTIYDFCEHRARALPRISMIMASDCAILFTRNHTNADRLNGLLALLKFVKHMNRSLIVGNRSLPFTTTCSIAYGTFEYEDRAEFPDLRKNYLFGRPYLETALDQKKGKPKIRPGECRLLSKTLPRNIRSQEHPLLSFMLRRGNRRYFYWMLNNPDNQKDFDKDYSCAYKLRKRDNFSEVISVLKSYVNREVKAE